MEANVLCSKGQCSPAVCCCFCEFPIPALCREHLANHPADAEGSFHFHVPLSTPQAISTKEAWVRSKPRLYRMREAALLLKDTNEDLNRFEEQIESARHETLLELEADIATMKQHIAHMRETFNAELQTAVRDTSMHAGDQWAPEEGSLADVIWNFDYSDISRLKVFTLSAGKPCVRQTFCIESRLPSFARFNRNSDMSADNPAFQRIQTELADAMREIEKLKTENAAIRIENQSTLASLVHISDTSESLKSRTDAHIKQIDKDNQRIRFECESQVKRLKLELARLKKSSEKPPMHVYDSQLSVRADGNALRSQAYAHKAAGRYQESAEFFGQAWRLIKHKDTAWKQTAVTGVQLSEVLGLHLGQFAAAESVIAETLRVVTARCSMSEAAFQLWNLRSAICFHSNRICDCEAASAMALATFADSNLPHDLYWTARYYLAFALCGQGKIAEAKDAWSDWTDRQMTHSGLSHLMRHCIRGRIMLGTKIDREAELVHKEAAIMAEAHFSTSIFAATNSYQLGVIYQNTSHLEEAKTNFSDAYRVFSTHFIGSFYSALSHVAGGDFQRPKPVSLRHQPSTASPPHFQSIPPHSNPHCSQPDQPSGRL